MSKKLISLIVLGAVLVLAAIAQAAIKSGTYTGQTSERISVTLRIRGHTLKSLKTEIGYDGKCGQGGGPGYTIDAKNITIGKHGKFSAHIKLFGPVASVKTDPGTLTGTASGNQVHGRITDTRIAKLSKCDAYTETFTATHKG